MRYKKREFTDVIYAVSKILCVVGGVLCFGIVLGSFGAIEVAPDGFPHGAVKQVILGVFGMLAFWGISEKLD